VISARGPAQLASHPEEHPESSATVVDRMSERTTAVRIRITE
jgi:hypothetical protein